MSGAGSLPLTDDYSFLNPISFATSSSTSGEKDEPYLSSKEVLTSFSSESSSIALCLASPISSNSSTEIKLVSSCTSVFSSTSISASLSISSILIVVSSSSVVFSGSVSRSASLVLVVSINSCFGSLYSTPCFYAITFSADS